MKKLLGIVVLGLLLSSNAYAEWTLIATSKSDDVFYLDLKTIKKKSGNRYFWVLTDLKKTIEGGNYSAKQLIQIDCELNRFQMLQAFVYTGQMGKGNLTNINIDNPTWEWSSPGSVWSKIINKVCKW